MDSQTQEYQEYYVPTQSYFPIVASISLFCLAFGAASVLTAVENTGDMGMIMLFTGFILLFFVILKKKKKNGFSIVTAVKGFKK